MSDLVPVVASISLDELIASVGSESNKSIEIVNGVWVAKEDDAFISVGHGRIGVRIIRLLDAFVQRMKLGEIYMSDTIFVLNIDESNVRSVRKPDIAFVKSEHVQANDAALYFRAPDLAIEILSPSDTPRVIYEKLSDYFTFGTSQVWLVYPAERKLVVHEADGTAKTYVAGETFVCGEPLLGLEVDVSQRF
jgi:Uma2 family endonuclease